MKKHLAFAILIGFLSGAILAADGLPPGKWWQRPEVVRQLSITPEQQGQLEDVFRGHAGDLVDLRAQTEKDALALRAELDRPELQRQAIQAAAVRLNASRGRLFERELMMLVDMRGVLTSEQWNRLRSHLDRRGEQRGQGPMRRPQRRP